jgi:GAF domain-containing protein/biotin carboxyl carrier protein
MPDSSDERARLDAAAVATVLAELALCENLSQISGWAAKWSAELTGADAALLWAPDTVHPIYLSIGAYGRGTEKLLRRSVPRNEGFLRDLLRDRRPATLERIDVTGSKDPFLKTLPAEVDTALVLPLEAEGISVGVLALVFRKRPNTIETLTRVKAFVQHAAPALARALRAERKTVGMLHAIERLTNLYDLSKAFGSTIDLAELNGIILRKAVDFGVSEVASLWFFDADTSEVIVAGSAVNDNYEVSNPPDAVGSSIVGDLLAERRVIRRAGISDEDPLAKENDGYPIRSVLAFPLLEEEKPIGALVLANKRGRHPEFTEEDQELLQDLVRQAVRALRNAHQYEAEKKVEELDALLTVSREITATLDLDKVMQKIVNATAAIATYDQCAIAILDRGKLKLGAVSGVVKLDRGDPKMKALEDLLEWFFFGGANVSVTQDPQGNIHADRPETEEKFRTWFQQSGYRSFHGLMLADEEGKLGVLSFASRKPAAFDPGTLDLLAILVNQATVAVRNAQLYKQVPLPGFLRPIAEMRGQLLHIPKHRRLTYAAVAAAVLLLLFVVPWRVRIEGPARVVPARRASVTAGVDGIVRSVLRREGDVVVPGEVIATLQPSAYAASLADARAEYQIAESEVARYREAGDSASMFEAASRRDELKARIAMEEDRYASTSLRAPVGGTIVTPRVDQRVGQFLTKGTELCVIADTASILAEVAVPEVEASLVAVGEPVALKLNPYPTHTFRGVLTRVGSYVRDDGKDRFIVCEARAPNPGGMLKTGMLGKAKVATKKVPIAVALFRKPFRYVWNKVWPLLP